MPGVEVTAMGSLNAFARGKGNQQAEIEDEVAAPVSYTHLRAHETVLDLVCRLLLEKKKQMKGKTALGTTVEEHHM